MSRQGGTLRADANMRRLKAAIQAADESGLLSAQAAERLTDVVRGILDAGDLQTRIGALEAAEALTASEFRDAVSAYIEARAFVRELEEE